MPNAATFADIQQRIAQNAISTASMITKIAPSVSARPSQGTPVEAVTKLRHSHMQRSHKESRGPMVSEEDDLICGLAAFGSVSRGRSESESLTESRCFKFRFDADPSRQCHRHAEDCWRYT